MRSALASAPSRTRSVVTPTRVESAAWNFARLAPVQVNLGGETDHRDMTDAQRGVEAVVAHLQPDAIRAGAAHDVVEQVGGPAPRPDAVAGGGDHAANDPADVHLRTCHGAQGAVVDVALAHVGDSLRRLDEPILHGPAPGSLVDRELVDVVGDYVQVLDRRAQRVDDAGPGLGPDQRPVDAAARADECQPVRPAEGDVLVVLVGGLAVQVGQDEDAVAGGRLGLVHRRPNGHAGSGGGGARVGVVRAQARVADEVVVGQCRRWQDESCQRPGQREPPHPHPPKVGIAWRSGQGEHYG